MFHTLVQRRRLLQELMLNDHLHQGYIFSYIKIQGQSAPEYFQRQVRNIFSAIHQQDTIK